MSRTSFTHVILSDYLKLMKYLILLLMLTTSTVIAQKQKPDYYLYNKDWGAAKDVSSADYILQLTNIGDSLFVTRIFKGGGYLWRQESFQDEAQTLPHGQFAWYDDEGRIDSSGSVNNKRKHGDWSYFDDTLGIFLSVKYENGKEIQRRDYINKLIKTPGSEITFDQEKKQSDSLLKALTNIQRDEKEAVFKGGPAGYKKYLERNLEPPTNLIKTGTVKMQFIINKTGNIQNLLILRSVQLSADVEALRVLSEMPAWTPAFQNGKNVFYQCLQSLTFRVI